MRNHSAFVCDRDTPVLYREAMLVLEEAGVPFLVGGAYALSRYTGIDRFTKDFDLFAMERDCDRALDALASIGCETARPFRHWLAKARRDDELIDIIYSSGNGVATVDDVWFAHAPADQVCGVPVKLCPPEELLWSKSFVMERERYDGADVMHLIHSLGPTLDWEHVLERFGQYWRVLLSHLVLYSFVYPAERSRIPRDVMEELTQRLAAGWSDDEALDGTCLGTLVSREQYLVDIGADGYRDGRLVQGVMTPGQIAEWTAAIARQP